MNILDKQEFNFNDYEIQTALLRALAHPTRLAILHLLREGTHCVCHIEAHLGLRQAYISQQLTVLRAAGLVEISREGWNVFYSVVSPSVFSILDAIQKQTGTQTVVNPARNVQCPCPKCSGHSSTPVEITPKKEKNA